MSNAVDIKKFINMNDQRMEDLEEGEEIEMLVRARITLNGRFTDPKTIAWRSLGTNYFDQS